MSSNIFKKTKKGVKFIGNFEKYYRNNDDYWNQDLTTPHLKEEYLYSRNQILHHLSQINFNSLMDIGCGNGFFTSHIFKKFPKKKISGCDISNTAVKQANNKYGDTIYFKKFNINVKKLEYQYDVILLNQVLYYIIEDYDASFKNIINSTKKYILISVFMNKNHTYGDEKFRKVDLFIEYIEKLNLKILDQSSKLINENNCHNILVSI